MQYFNDASKDVAEGFLEGGLTQVVWHPAKRDGSADQLKNAIGDTYAAQKVSFPDMVEGDVIKNSAGATQPYGVRVKINDPRIEGPFETGWGFKDFEDQHDIIGLPNPLKE